jgi:hypothetical protein
MLLLLTMVFSCMAVVAGIIYLLPFGDIKSKIMGKMTSAIFKTFSCGTVSLSPLRIENFEVRTFGTLTMPEVGVNWAVFEINTYFHDWVHMNFENKLISISFEDMYIDIPVLSFADILDPPDNPKKPSGSPLTVVHKLALCFEMKITELTVCMVFPDIKSRVDLHTTSMSLHFELNDKDSHALDAAVTFENGHVLVTIDNEESVEYSGHEANMKVSINIPTSMMKVDIKLSGKDTTTVQAQRFLEFFDYFNTADDNSIEVKLAWGMPAGGKMALMVVHMEEMMVFMTDRRSTVAMVMAMEDVCASLATVRLPPEANGSGYSDQDSNSNSSHVSSSACADDDDDDDSIGVGDWVADAEGSNFEKTISVTMKHLQFVGQRGCNVSGVSVIIKKTVVNSGEYIDHEDMTVEVDQVIFPWIDKLFLEWLLIAQNVADVLPNSRFGHAKGANMTAKINLMQMALSPVDYGHDQSVRFTFHDLFVAKTQQPRDETSHFSLNFTSLDILSSRPYASLQQRFTVDFDTEQQATVNECTLSVLYKVMEVSAKFSLGDDFQLHTVRILEVHIVEDTHTGPSLHSSPSSSASVPSRIVPLYRLASISIAADPKGMEVSIDRMTGTMGFASILKCLCTYEMVMDIQDKISDTMDLIKVATAPLCLSPHIQSDAYPSSPAAYVGTVYVASGASALQKEKAHRAETGSDAPNDEIVKTIRVTWHSMELVLALDLPSGSPSVNGEPKLYFDLTFSDLFYSTQGESNRMEFPSLVITANGAKQFEFLTISNFHMQSGKKLNTHRHRNVDDKMFRDVTVWCIV